MRLSVCGVSSPANSVNKRKMRPQAVLAQAASEGALPYP